MAEDKKLNPEELGNVAGGYVYYNNDKKCPKCKKVYKNPPFENCEICGTKLEKVDYEVYD